MKKLIKKLLPALALLWPLITWAVPDTRITVQGSNVILSWPSAGGQTFIIQYRTNLDANTPWTTLTSSKAAATGTNRTAHTHTGAATFTACSGGGSGGPSGGPPVPSSSSLMTTGSSPSSSLRVAGIDGAVDATTERARYFDGPAPQVRRGLTRRHAPEQPPMPPTPEEMARQREARIRNGGDGVMLLSSQPDCGLATGFYRVARHGIVAYGLTANATYSGAVNFPVEIGMPNKPDVRSITAVVGSAPLPWSEIAQQDSGLWEMSWNTSFVPNGNYAIKLVTVFMDESAVTNTAVNVTVNNPLSFPVPYAAAFGSQLWVRAKFNQPNVQWEMDVYGEAGDYIGTFGDFSADGNISFVWNLLDPGQNYRTDQFLPAFSTT